LKLFITGTSTEVGKTYVTRLLLQALGKLGLSATGFKPIACGDRTDAEGLAECSSPVPPSIDLVNPVFFKNPAAPMAASLIEATKVDIPAIKDAYQALAGQYEYVLVEGIGGWAVPISAEYSMADLAADLKLPVLVVVDNRLGAINHTVLTANAIKAMGLEVAGIVLNHVADERDAASISNRIILEQLLSPPFILDILHGTTEIQWPFPVGKDNHPPHGDKGRA
jgi:dethiobiotin synthetase